MLRLIFFWAETGRKRCLALCGSELPLSGPAMRMIWLLHRLIAQKDGTTRQQLEPMLRFYHRQLWYDAMETLPKYLYASPPSLASVCGRWASAKTTEKRRGEVKTRSRRAHLLYGKMQRIINGVKCLFERNLAVYVRTSWGQLQLS